MTDEAHKIRWKRATGDFVESHCGRWWITPVYGGLMRPESYELQFKRLPNAWCVVGSGSTQRECKEDADRLHEELSSKEPTDG